MKRFVCLLLCLLLPACALADNLETTFALLKVNCAVCGAPELPETYTKSPSDSFDLVTYDLGEHTKVGLFDQNGNIVGGFAVCTDPAAQGDFIALCAAQALTFCGITEGINAYIYILDMFLDARQGKENKAVPVGGVLLQINPMQTGLNFVCTKIGD